MTLGITNAYNKQFVEVPYKRLAIVQPDFKSDLTLFLGNEIFMPSRITNENQNWGSQSRYKPLALV